VKKDNINKAILVFKFNKRDSLTKIPPPLLDKFIKDKLKIFSNMAIIEKNKNNIKGSE
jgi:hypothetical protein